MLRTQTFKMLQANGGWGGWGGGIFLQIVFIKEAIGNSLDNTDCAFQIRDTIRSIQIGS